MLHGPHVENHCLILHRLWWHRIEKKKNVGQKWTHYLSKFQNSDNNQAPDYRSQRLRLNTKSQKVSYLPRKPASVSKLVGCFIFHQDTSRERALPPDANLILIFFKMTKENISKGPSFHPNPLYNANTLLSILVTMDMKAVACNSSGGPKLQQTIFWTFLCSKDTSGTWQLPQQCLLCSEPSGLKLGTHMLHYSLLGMCLYFACIKRETQSKVAHTRF